MSNHINPDDNINVACVIGREVRLYGDLEKGQIRRRLYDVRQFTNHGNALLFAAEFEEKQRKAKLRYSYLLSTGD